jgi:hypothetical protein
MNETTYEEVHNVAVSLHYYELTEAQVEYVIQNFDEIAERDPSGDRVLWIEQLIYEFDDHCK